MKKIKIIDVNGKPFSRTYSRRADNLVKKGRAIWVDDDTIQTLPLPSQGAEEDIMTEDIVEDMVIGMVEDMIEQNQSSKPIMVKVTTPDNETLMEGTTPWVEYFKGLSEKLADSEDLTRCAIEAIRSTHTGPGPDMPARAIAQVFEAHMNSRNEIFKRLMEFVDKRHLR